MSALYKFNCNSIVILMFFLHIHISVLPLFILFIKSRDDE